MPPIDCYTCGEEIIFDKNIRSKTGKQIPLFPDGQNTHGHDDDGNPIRGPLPTAQIQSQQPTKTFQSTTLASSSSSSGESQGGSYMDTKRIRVMLEELGTKINAFEESLTAIYQLNKSNNTMLGELIQHFGINSPKPATDLYKVMEHTKQEALKKEKDDNDNDNDKEYHPEKVKGWNSIVPPPVSRDVPEKIGDDL